MKSAWLVSIIGVLGSASLGIAVDCSTVAVNRNGAIRSYPLGAACSGLAGEVNVTYDAENATYLVDLLTNAAEYDIQNPDNTKIYWVYYDAGAGPNLPLKVTNNGGKAVGVYLAFRNNYGVSRVDFTDVDVELGNGQLLGGWITGDVNSLSTNGRCVLDAEGDLYGTVDCDELGLKVANVDYTGSVQFNEIAFPLVVAGTLSGSISGKPSNVVNADITINGSIASTGELDLNYVNSDVTVVGSVYGTIDLLRLVKTLSIGQSIVGTVDISARGDSAGIVLSGGRIAVGSNVSGTLSLDEVEAGATQPEISVGGNVSGTFTLDEVAAGADISVGGTITGTISANDFNGTLCDDTIRSGGWAEDTFPNVTWGADSRVCGNRAECDGDAILDGDCNVNHWADDCDVADDIIALSNKANLTVGDFPRLAVAAQLDNVNGLDLVVSDSWDSNVRIILADENPFEYESGVTYGGPSSVGGITAADFNRDGYVDVAAVGWNNANVWVYTNKGATDPGALNTAVQYSVGSQPGPAFVVAADFDKDLYPDLAVSNKGAGEVWVLLNDGDGTFDDGSSTYSIDANAYPHAIAVADYNGDTWLDIAVVNYGNGAGFTDSFSILLNNGDDPTTFDVDYTVPLASGGPKENPLGLVTGNFDGDAWPDLAIASRTSNKVWAYLNDGDGTFTVVSGHPITLTETELEVLAATDLDMNGTDDLIVPSRGAHRTVILPNDGSGGFSNSNKYLTDAVDEDAPYAAGAADLDEDGRIDVVVPVTGNNKVRIYENVRPPVYPDCNDNGLPDACDIGDTEEDCNSNGEPDSCDIASGDSDDCNGDGVPDECHECNNPPFDTDNDGDVDLTDYGAFLTCYNGPNKPYAAASATCVCVDQDSDCDVDLTDYGVFLSCYNGPNRPPGEYCPGLTDGLDGGGERLVLDEGGACDGSDVSFDLQSNVEGQTISAGTTVWWRVAACVSGSNQGLAWYTGRVELRSGSATGPLVPSVTPSTASQKRVFDVGGNGAPNGAFASNLYPNGGPYMGMVVGGAAGEGFLEGFGAAYYPNWTYTTQSTRMSHGVGRDDRKSALLLDEEGDYVIQRGSIDTTGLDAGTYYVVFVPPATVGVLRDDVDLEDDVDTNVVALTDSIGAGDSISFTISSE